MSLLFHPKSSSEETNKNGYLKVTANKNYLSFDTISCIQQQLSADTC